ncbi:non-homologous end-joining DNA ligase [Pseudonocardia benzenivorans]|uniref:DNA polymerase LigD, polymerase domain protein n=2 Tax=Pseudonocardia TaxID=1847 RepID=F4CPI4_PSEUX|nr:non-homologous end-joining DNA ligase [Pseudonocardia dioxanivorans]AEA25101.1 DNA polymerase LigD, polymerase domain protein [Pseudonocardia dioxanivorans CB1190]GJF06657.1 ATP-dependent DNA ligase [Pseudonocardia sp. D17]
MAAKTVVQLTVPGPEGDREVRLSSPDKVYFPARGITKRQVVEYYLAVSEPMTRVLLNRPTNLKRFPDGVDGEPFFAKRLPKGAPPWVRTATVTFPSGRKADTLAPSEPAVIAWAANLGTLDFHPWPVRAADTDRPDELRIDLDPQPGTDFADAVAVAAVLREVLDEAGLVGWPKTSGGRGIHVFARIRPEWSFIEVRRAVIAIARRVCARIPEQATVDWWKEERGERVFLDYNQAARDRTIASAWSVRGLPRATVSMPLTWEALPSVEPEDFDLLTVPGLLARDGDPHAGMDDAVGGIETALEWFAADERDRGLGELPYPPEYPKMPGEPMRVQPSRARAGKDAAG